MFDGNPAAPEKDTTLTQFLAHVYCGQTLSVGPGHTVLDGDPSSPRKGHSSPSPLFGPAAHIYCGHGRPSQLLVSSCKNVIDYVARKIRTDGQLYFRFSAYHCSRQLRFTGPRVSSTFNNLIFLIHLGAACTKSDAATLTLCGCLSKHICVL